MYKELIDYVQKFSDLEENYIMKIVEDVPVNEYAKGAILLNQGDVVNLCYFVLRGCVRQFIIDEDGKETTTNFFTEGDTIAIFGTDENVVSKYSLVCSEHSVLLVAEVNSEVEAYKVHPELIEIIPKMLEAQMGMMQERFSDFMSSSPEERFKSIMATRPELIERVPQHQLASYLGITAESLSRIKRRVYSNIRLAK